MKILIGLMISIGLWGQQRVTLTAPPPMPVSGVSVNMVGNQGQSTYYYWVVANYTIGKAAASPATVVINAPTTLSGSNYLRVSWNLVNNALSYDVLRTTTNNISNPCNCAVVTGLGATVGSYNDQNNAPGAYTLNSVGTADGSIYLDNQNFVQPTFIPTRPGLGGSGSIPNTTSALKGDGIGNAAAVVGVATDCVKVDGTSGACGTGGSSNNGGVDCVDTSGSFVAYVCAVPSPVPTSYATGMLLALKPQLSNGGAATVNVAGLGVKSLLTNAGVALSAVALTGGSYYLFEYNGTSFVQVSGSNTIANVAGFGMSLATGTITITPGVYGYRNVITTVSSGTTCTITSGVATEIAYFYLTQGALHADASTNVISCPASGFGSFIAGVGNAFPVGSLPIGTWSMVTGAFDPAGYGDARPTISGVKFTAGTGISLVETGGTVQIISTNTFVNSCSTLNLTAATGAGDFNIPATTAEIGSINVPANATMLPSVFIEVATFGGNAGALSFCLTKSGDGSSCTVQLPFSVKQSAGTLTNDLPISASQSSLTVKLYANSTSGNLSTLSAGNIVGKVCWFVNQ